MTEATTRAELMNHPVLRMFRARMSPKEYEEWLQTEEALVLLCQEASWNKELCGPEFERLRELDEQKAHKRWEHYLNVAKTRIKLNWTPKEQKEFLLLSEEERKDFLAIMAENMMISDLCVPPHFTGYVVCEQCGVVPESEDLKGVSVMTCGWCSVLNYEGETHD